MLKMFCHPISSAKFKSMSRDGNCISLRDQKNGLDGESAMVPGDSWSCATRRFASGMPEESISTA